MREAEAIIRGIHAVAGEPSKRWGRYSGALQSRLGALSLIEPFTAPTSGAGEHPAAPDYQMG
jgi:hypothetical protein